MAAAICHSCALHAVRRRPERRDVYPPVSVLTPLCGIEEGLYDNLAALASQDYPTYELIIGAADPGDWSLSVAERVRHDFPKCRVKVVGGAPVLGANPKVRNLANLAEHARHGLLLVADSNVRPGTGHLRSLADQLARPGAGLATSLLIGTSEATLGATFENLHLNCFVAGTVAATHVVGHPVVVGKSMLFARCDLERVGGFAAVADVLAEDYLLGRRFAVAGLSVVLSPQVLPVVNHRRSLGEFVGRHVRWAQMRRRVCSGAFFAEPLLNPTPWLLGLLAAAVHHQQTWAASTAVLGLVAKLGGDALLTTQLRGVRLTGLAIALIPLKDLMLAAIWLVGALRREVDWRGHRLTVGAGSRITRHEPSASGRDQ